MGLLKKLFGLSETSKVEEHQDSKSKKVEINRPTDPNYQIAIASIPVMWKQYGESLRLLKNTIHCDTYFDRKDFVITRLGSLQKTINLVGGSDSFIDPMTNTDITVYSTDIDGIITDIKSDKYDEAFIRRYAEALNFKISSLKTSKAKLNNIFKWQQWIEPYKEKLSPELFNEFKLYCKKLEVKINREIEG